MPRISLSLVRLLARPQKLPISSFISRPSPTKSSLTTPLASLYRTPFRVNSPLTWNVQSPSPIFGALLQIRSKAYGSEYQPSQRKRKRKHGFLARKKSITGRKILVRRLEKKRKFLSH